jgi:DNA-directed RNA polymerase specialized sigma24 family protein
VAEATIEDLFRAHWSLVLGFLVRQTRDVHLAEEIAQETFVRAARAFLGWRGGCPAAWLLTIARNTLVDHVHHADDQWLKQLGLPGSDQLKQIAQDGKIYGFVWNGASPAQLKALLERADVRSVAISDAVFNVSG